MNCLPIDRSWCYADSLTHREQRTVRGVRLAMSSDLLSHLRRIAVLLGATVCRTWIPFILMGVLNRVFPIFSSVFFCYPGNARYSKHYSYALSRSFLRWFPFIIGIFRQGKKWGLICAASVTESEFTQAGNGQNLRRLVRRLQWIKVCLGVNKLSFAGILPTVLYRNHPRLFANPDVSDGTSEVVRRAVHEVRSKHFAGRPHHVVLLGGAGRIGRGIRQLLASDGIEPVVIDPVAPSGTGLKNLRGEVLLVDVSRHGAIRRHLCEIPEGTVFLNEVFPEPSRKVLKEFKHRNITAYHLAGVRGEVYPPLPLGYRNAVPCCAMHSDGSGEPVLVRIA